MTRRLRAPLIAAALALAVAVGGVGMLVLPQRQHADALDRQIQTTRARVDAAGVFARTYHPEALDSADLFRLSKSMPSDVGMPDLLLQLERIAGRAGITLDSVAPRDPVQHAGYRSVPIDLTARGSFYAVSDFLLRLRSSVRVRGSNLDVNGRLYAIDRLALSRPGRAGDLRASLTVSAFAFDGLSALPATGTAASAAAATKAASS